LLNDQDWLRIVKYIKALIEDEVTDELIKDLVSHNEEIINDIKLLKVTSINKQPVG
jgi:ribosomal protein L20A (L18A)